MLASGRAALRRHAAVARAPRPRWHGQPFRGAAANPSAKVKVVTVRPVRAALLRLFARYEHYNDTYPIMVRGGTGIALFLFGDFIAQKIAHNQEAEAARNGAPSSQRAKEADFVWDGQRAAITSSWRAAVWAPVATVFWHYLDKVVTIGGARGVALKILIDACTIGPPVVFSYLVWSKWWEQTLDGAPGPAGPEAGAPTVLSTALTTAKGQFVTVMIRGYCYWIPLHVITYGFVPARHRLVWVSACSIGFATLLSWSTHDEAKVGGLPGAQ